MVTRYFPSNLPVDPIPQQTSTVYEDYLKIKGFEDIGYFLVAYVVAGGLATLNITRNDTIDVNDTVVSLNNDVMFRAGTSFSVTTKNATYYLDFTKEGDFSWSTSHPTGTADTDYLTLATITTDSDGNVDVITDTRGSVGGLQLKPDSGWVTEAELIDLAGEDRTTETVKGNADDITNLAGTGRTTETVKGNADDLAAHEAEFAKETSRVFNVKGYGATGDGTTDDSAAIKATIAAATSAGGGIVFFPEGTYIITEPLVITSKITIQGSGVSVSIIQKTTNTEGTYDEDSIITIDYVTVDEYSYHCKIEDINLLGKTSTRTVYGVYAPRNTHFTMRSCYIKDTDYGYNTNDSWLTVFERVTVQNCIRGFQWKPTTAASGGAISGTSLVMSDCWVVAASDVGYYFEGLLYSTLNSCALDNSGSDASPIIAYDILYSNMVMNGCAAENVVGTILRIEQSYVTVNTMNPIGAEGTTSTSYAPIHLKAEANVTFNSCVFQTMATPRNSKNMIVEDFARAVFINSILPRGGAVFTIPTNANIVQLGLLTAETGYAALTEHRYSFGAYKSTNQTLTTATTFYQVLFETEEFDYKSNYDASTSIFTVPRTGLYRFTVNLYFSAIAAGGRVQALLYREGIGEIKHLGDYTNNGAAAQTHTMNASVLVSLPKDAQVKIQAVASVNNVVINANASNTYFSGIHEG